jgi:hypothetical protein
VFVLFVYLPRRSGSNRPSKTRWDPGRRRIRRMFRSLPACPTPSVRPETDSKSKPSRPSPLRRESGLEWPGTDDRRLPLLLFSETKNTPRTSLCGRVSKTHLAWGSTRAACHLIDGISRSIHHSIHSNGLGVLEVCTAVLQTAGPGALPGGSTNHFNFLGNALIRSVPLTTR